MKLTKAKTAAKTAKFQATMASKRKFRAMALEAMNGPSEARIPLSAIPDRAPARTRLKSVKNKRTSLPTSAGTMAVELIRIALRMLEEDK